MGNLFYRRVQPSEINAMDYSEMKYWNGWHLLMEQAEKDAIKDAENKGKRKSR
jgi:hypothetical protein